MGAETSFVYTSEAMCFQIRILLYYYCYNLDDAIDSENTVPLRYTVGLLHGSHV